MLAGSATELWQYLLCAGFLGGLGSASLGMIAASALLSRWFTSRIGTIVSIPYAAIGAGMLILPPLTQFMLASTDWRTAHRLLGVGVLIMLPLIMLAPLKRITAGSPEWRELRSRPVTATAGPWTVATAVRTGAFWGLFAAYLFTSVAAYSVLPHSVAYLIEEGFNPLVAASAFGFTGMLSVFGILAIGWLSDRFGRLRSATFVLCFDDRWHRRADARFRLAVACAGVCVRLVLRADARARADPSSSPLSRGCFRAAASALFMERCRWPWDWARASAPGARGCSTNGRGTTSPLSRWPLPRRSCGLSMFWGVRSLREERVEAVRLGLT